MALSYSFGEWVKQRRKTLHLTQRDLASNAACAVATIKKIEADERRPSVEMAMMIGSVLGVPDDWEDTFIECARGQRPLDALQNMSMDEPHNTRLSRAAPNPEFPIIGRDAELRDIMELITQPECRLLTLVGQGGIGKTRLALEVSQRLAETIEHEVVFVPLASVTRAELIPIAIIQALNLSFTGEEQLVSYLQLHPMLIILDNCEQFQDDVIWFSTLLSHAPQTKLLVTSRERLKLAEEWVFTVTELPSVQAFKLFEQTASRSKPDFSPPAYETAIKSICNLVGNLPLAIELAASWLPVMPVEHIADYIQEDLDFLSTDVRNIPERQRSIRAVYEHSWKLLAEPEQDVLMRLSVFRGGWTMEVAMSVAGANLARLRTLVEKSLVRVAANGRYDLHELTRQFATEQLQQAHKGSETCGRHLEAFIDFTGEMSELFTGPQAIDAFHHCDQELDNIRAALRYAVDHKKSERALQLVQNMFNYWLRRGYYQEAERWHRDVLEVCDNEDNPQFCISLIHLSIFLAVQGRYVEAMPFLDRADKLAHRLEDPYVLMTLYELQTQGVPSIEQVTTFFQRCEQLMQQWDHPARPGRLGTLYSLYADRLRRADRSEEAKAYYHKSLDLFRSINNVDMIAYPIGNLGRIKLDEGHLQEAYHHFLESVKISRKIGNRVGIADWLQYLGKALLLMGELSEAGACFEEAHALYEEIGNLRAMPDMLAHLGRVALARNDTDAAHEYITESLRQYRSLLIQFYEFSPEGATPFTWDFVHSLLCSVLVAEMPNEMKRAVTIFTWVESMLDELRMNQWGSYGHFDMIMLEEARVHIQKMYDDLTDDQLASIRKQANSMDNLNILNYALNE